MRIKNRNSRPLAIKINDNNFTRILYTVIILYAIIMYFATNISIECDSATYFNFAKSLCSNSPTNLLRGPGYPVFLILTGFIWPGTILGTIFAQFVLGVSSAILILKYFSSSTRTIKLLITFLLVSTSITFSGVKILLAEQLAMFLIVSGVYFLKKYIDSEEVKYIVGASIFAVMAYLTRFETVGLLCSVFFLMIYYYYRKKISGKVLIGLILIPFFVLTSWSFLRAYINDDLSLVGSISSEKGAQLLWSHHMAQNMIAKKDLKNYFDLEESKTTKTVVKILKQEIEKDPNLVLSRIENLTKDPSYEDELKRIWNPVRANPKEIVDLYFGADQTKRSTQVIPIIQEILQKEFGKKSADKTMQKIVIESIIKNPELMMAYFSISKSHLGLNFQENRFSFFNNKINYWAVDFNIIDCAKNSLTTNQFTEYKRYHIQQITFLESPTAFFRLLLRILFGLSFIYIALSLLVKSDKNKVQSCMLICTQLGILFTYSISMVGPGSKYDPIVGAVSIVMVGLVLTNLHKTLNRVRL